VCFAEAGFTSFSLGPTLRGRDNERGIVYDLYALRALRYFASFAFNVFLERIPCAKLAKYRKARGVGRFLRRTPIQLMFRQMCWRIELCGNTWI